MKYHSFFVCILILSILVSCKKKNPLEPGSVFFYFNSFETAGDANDWHGVHSEMFVEDPAPNGGQKSLRIGGGCVQPTAWLTFSELERSRTFKLSCWGNVIEDGQVGTLTLYVMNGEEYGSSISIQIEGGEWTLYESDNLLVCPSGKHLRLEIMIGGIVGATMHLDCLAVEMVG